jgi:hypothetical protein
VSLTGSTTSLTSPGAGLVEAHDVVRGAPFGSGSLVLTGALEEGLLKGTFRLLFKGGSVTGTVAVPFTISGSEIDVVGPARVTGGTGAYRGISAKGLVLHDHRTLDGKTSAITVTGSVTY